MSVLMLTDEDIIQQTTVDPFGPAHKWTVAMAPITIVAHHQSWR